MLIVGNVANRHYLDSPSNSLVEVLCLEDNKDNVKRALGINSTSIDTTMLSDTYLHRGTRYIIYKSSQVPVITELLLTHCDVPERITIASPLATFAWTLMKSKFLHKFINSWEENITVCSTLFNQYIKYSSHRAAQLARTTSLLLTGCGALSRGCKLKGYEYNGYNYFTRTSLFDLYGSGINSKYEGLALSRNKNGANKDILSKTHFENYSYESKIEAIMERLYVDTANEFLLPDMIEKVDSEIAVKVQFKTSIMNLCSQSSNPWFTEFVICNFNTIMEEFNPNCASILYDALSLGLLDEPAINKIY